MTESTFKLDKSLKGKFNNYLSDNDKLQFIIELALNSRFSDIYITEWKSVQYKKNGIITLTKDMIPSDLNISPDVSSPDFHWFLKSIFPEDEDITVLSRILSNQKSFDYWVWYKFSHKKPTEKKWETEVVEEDIRLRLNFVNTVNWVMLTIRPLLNIGLTYENLTSMKWAVNYGKTLLKENEDDTIPVEVKKDALEQLEKMDTVSKIIKSDFTRRSGLILVTWSTWEWKSTLVTSLLEDILEKTDKHILTLEDPIEYVFKPKRWKVSQIEIGSHIKDFSSWIRWSKRENPDIVYIQEIRDKQSAEALVELLWSGVLVITTLHTWSVSETIDRLIWLMSEDANQDYIRSFISRQIISIINQKLIYVNHKERIITKWIQEYLHVAWSSRKWIKENKYNELESSILDSQPPNKSITKILWNFYLLWIISMWDLLSNVTNLDSLENLISDSKTVIRDDDKEELLTYFWVKSLENLK